MEPRPIRTEADHRRALDEIARLMEHPEAELSDADGETLELLTLLVEDYERRVHPLGLPNPIAAIESAMEQRGLSRADLIPAIGSRGRVSEVLGRKRPLSIGMIRALVGLLGLPAEVLIQPCATQQPGTPRRRRAASQVRDPV